MEDDSIRGGLTLSGFKSSYEAAVIEAVELMEGWTFIIVVVVESGEGYPSHTVSCILKSAKGIQWGKDNLLKNGAGKFRHP